jgi:glycosyltransferase involved in cell wall biosynthesis
MLNANSNSYRTRFTIIVPFRNEAANLPLLLDSISKLHTQRNGLILVDDDESEEVFSPHCSLFNIRIIKNNRVSNSLKRCNLHGDSLVSSEWIITTDADCVVPKTGYQHWTITFKVVM